MIGEMDRQSRRTRGPIYWMLDLWRDDPATVESCTNAIIAISAVLTALLALVVAWLSVIQGG
jgi:hypothetical protein